MFEQYASCFDSIKAIDKRVKDDKEFEKQSLEYIKEKNKDCYMLIKGERKKEKSK
jgi:hypothetical protein